MIAREVLLLFCAQVAAGTLVLLPLVSIELVGRSFYKIMVRVALAFLVLGHGIAPSLEGPGLVSFAGGIGAAVLSLIYLGLIERPDFAKRGNLLWAAGLLSLASLLARGAAGMTDSKLPGAWAGLDLLSLLAGAGLAGSVNLAMVLGHYYLNHPKLSIDPLRRYSIALMAFSGLRAVLFGLGIALVWTLPIPGSDPERGFFLEHMITLVQRGLFGVLGPCLLAWMNWETVKISSTQSATGILYADMVLVTLGELVFAWFLVTAKLPL